LNACASGSQNTVKTSRSATPSTAISAVTTEESVPTSLASAG
jgi:hypothetical protein